MIKFTVNNRPIDSVITSLVMTLMLLNILLLPFLEMFSMKLLHQVVKVTCLGIMSLKVFMSVPKFIVIKVFNSTLLFLILLLVYSIFSNHLEYIFPCSYVLISFLFFFIQEYKKSISRVQIQHFTFYLFFIAFVNIFMNWKDYLSDYNQLNELGGNNAGYLAVAVLSFLFLCPKHFIYRITFYTTLFLVLFAKKRGAIIAAIFYAAFYLKILLKISPNRNKKLRLLLFSAIIIFLSSIYLGDYVLDRFEGGTSGRDNIYSSFISLWSYSGVLKFFFGHGFYSTLDVQLYQGVSLYAHSDIIEVIYDFGVFGLIIYGYMLLSYFSSMVRMYNKNIDYSIKIGFIGLFIFYIIKMLISGVYLDIDSFLIMAPLGIYCAKSIKIE